MGNQTVIPHVQDRIRILQSFCDVVRAQNRDRSCIGQTFRTHHCDIRPWNLQDASRTIWCGADRSNAASLLNLGVHRVARQEIDQVGGDSYWPNAGPSSPVRNGEGFVQIQMRNIPAEFSGLSVSEQSIEVRSVNVNLATMLVHHIAQLSDTWFINAVSRRVSDHDRRELIAVQFTFGSQVVHVDAAIFVGLDHNNSHSGHNR